jgi:hypothetical protein
LNQARSLVPIKIGIFISFFIFIALLVIFAYDNTEDDFVSLFNGKTLDGWHIMNGANFKVEDRVIKLNGGKGWLRSDKEYSDFILRLQFRFLKPMQNGGVFIRASEEGENWPEQNYEIQVENSRRMAKIWGTDYELNADLAQIVLMRNGGWNEYCIRVVGSWIEVRLNGELVCTSDSLTELTRGYIGLQGENGFHEYRNIMINNLSN